ncbi:MAG: sugar phosphate isomerase/epimerase [Pleurocapsa minor GSE-CHR-MK-17-07R]|jgi:sugar phosphate isomerase/epimerase|nr:sugar phosphate isomerase/epimerase [Pleurocapsa minor GSE-CHR-MK 17-07R]
MNDWSATLDFGVVHPLIYLECRGGEGPVVETLRRIVGDSDFGAVEIAPVKNPQVRAQAQALLRSSQLQVVYLPILPILLEKLELGSADESARKVAVDRVKALIDEAIDFDSTLAMVQGPLDPGEAEREATTARLIEDLQTLCDYAEAQSTSRLLHLTLENFDRTVEKKRLVGPTRETVALADAVGRANFGLTIDLSHLPLLGESAAEALSLAAPHLLHAHIGNCVIDHPESPLYGDFHPRFGHPLGRNDLPEVVEFLSELFIVDYFARARARLGGTPIVSMELRTIPGEEESEAILANGKRTFIRAWSHVTQERPS